MKRPHRLRQPRILRRDWIGDAVLTVVCGGLLLVAVFLPWANEDGKGLVNFSVAQGGGLNGVLDTRWGVPALVIALAVVAAGVLMAVTRPRRYSILLGVLVAACGIAAFGAAQDAASHIGWYDPGVGMYLTTLVGVLLVPIGIAAAAVAWILVRAQRPAAAAPLTDPPAPENAPPS